MHTCHLPPPRHIPSCSPREGLKVHKIGFSSKAHISIHPYSTKHIKAHLRSIEVKCFVEQGQFIESVDNLNTACYSADCNNQHTYMQIYF